MEQLTNQNQEKSKNFWQKSTYLVLNILLLFLIIASPFVWIMRDGMGPNASDSNGFEALCRFFMTFYFGPLFLIIFCLRLFIGGRSHCYKNKLLQVVIIFTVLATIIVGGGYLILDYYKNGTENKMAKIINQETARENKIALQDELTVFEKESYLLDEVVETKNYALCEEANKPAFCLNFITQLTEDADFCDKIFEESEREQCLSELASQTGDYKICDNIKNRIFKNQCYIGAYNNLSDETACELLDEDLTLVTKDQCYFKTALNKKEENLCEQAGKFSDSCYYVLAIEKGDMDICDKVADSSLKNYCYYYNSIKDSFVRPCRLISENGLKNLCLAEASEKSIYCDEISDSQLKKHCRESIAYKTNNVDLCDHDSDCVTKIVVKTDEESLCENILNNQTAVKDCKITVAVENDNLDIGDLCLNSDSKIENNCFFELAVRTGNEKYCQDIKDKEFREVLDITSDRCFMKVAQTIADRTICDNITDKPTKDMCFEWATSEMVKVNDDPSFCEIIPDYYKDSCYYNIALKNNDYQFCEKIIDLLPTKYLSANKIIEEKAQACYEKVFFARQEEHLKNNKSTLISTENDYQNQEAEDPIVITVRQGDGLTHLAEQALNEFLLNMNFDEQEEFSGLLNLGQRVYIEDYIKDKIEKKEYYYVGDEVAFSRDLITEAIRASEKLTEKQIENISKYTYDKTDIKFELLSKKALSYCDFRSELSSYYNILNKEFDNLMCQVELTGDYNLCESINPEHKSYKVQCFERLIEGSNNYLICESFKNESSVNLCFSLFAKKLEDPEICDYRRDYMSKDTCLLDMMKINPSLDICEKISEDIFQRSCYKQMALKENDPLLCQKSNDPWCFIDLAEKTNDHSLCEEILKISPLDNAQYFKDMCYQKIGKNNPILCENIETDFLKFSCYQKLLIDENENYIKDSCAELNNTTDKNICFAVQAEQEGNIKLCGKINNETLGDVCEYNVSVKTKENHCNLMGDNSYKKYCLEKVAVANRDFNLCMTIDDRYERGKCVNNIANLLEDKDPCKLLEEDNTFKKNCGETYLGQK